jgi:hypothetical protein
VSVAPGPHTVDQVASALDSAPRWALSSRSKPENIWLSLTASADTLHAYSFRAGEMLTQMSSRPQLYVRAADAKRRTRRRRRQPDVYASR